MTSPLGVDRGWCQGVHLPSALCGTHEHTFIPVLPTVIGEHLFVEVTWKLLCTLSADDEKVIPCKIRALWQASLLYCLPQQMENNVHN